MLLNEHTDTFSSLDNNFDTDDMYDTVRCYTDKYSRNAIEGYDDAIERGDETFEYAHDIHRCYLLGQLGSAKDNNYAASHLGFGEEPNIDARGL